MKRTASFSTDSVAGTYRNAGPSSMQAETGDAGNGDGIDGNHLTVDVEPGQTEAMAFPGPFAHDPVPAAVARFGQADGAATPTVLTLPGASSASSSATTTAAHADAPGGSAFAGAAQTGNTAQPLLPDGAEVEPDGLPPLHLAAQRGDLGQLRTLLDQPGADIEQLDRKSNFTALMYAARASNGDAVELLLSRGANLNFTNPVNGRTALMEAAATGKLDVVDALLKHPGIDRDMTKDDGWNALAIASSFGHLSVVERLIAAGAEVNFINPVSGRTALMYAAAADKLDVVDALLKHPGIGRDMTDNDGRNALAIASSCGHPSVVERLIAAGADVNFINPIYGGTALMNAAATGKLEVVDALLKHPGIGRDMTDNDGRNALALASSFGHPSVVERLIAAGADVNFINPIYGGTALMNAAATGKLEVVDALLKHPGIGRDMTDNDGCNALTLASSFGHLSVVERLIAAGADVNFINPVNGRTALMEAAEAGKLEVVNALLKYPEIRVNLIDAHGLNALGRAANAGDVGMVEQLIDAGAKITSLCSYDCPEEMYCVYRNLAEGCASELEENRNSFQGWLKCPMLRLSAGFEHEDCLFDLLRDQGIPVISTDNPLGLAEPGLFDEPIRFFQELRDKLEDPDVVENNDQTWAFSEWLAEQGIRSAVLVPIMNSLGNLSKVWKILAAPGRDSPTEQQKQAYCASIWSRLALLAPDEQLAEAYAKHGVSAAGVTRLSTFAIAQRDKLVAIGEETMAPLAEAMLNQIVPGCHAKTGHDFGVDVDALRTSMINAGFVAPLAGVLANGWSAAIQKLLATPVAMPVTQSMMEMVTFIRDRVAAESPQLFIKEILRGLDSRDLLAEWQVTLGKKSTDGLFGLFNDQCRQLREYCKQMGQRGE